MQQTFTVSTPILAVNQAFVYVFHALSKSAVRLKMTITAPLITSGKPHGISSQVNVPCRVMTLHALAAETVS